MFYKAPVKCSRHLSGKMLGSFDQPTMLGKNFCVGSRLDEVWFRSNIVPTSTQHIYCFHHIGTCRVRLTVESFSTRRSCCYGGQPELNCQQVSRTWTRYAVVMIVREAYKLLFASVLVYQNCKVFFIKGMASSTEQIVNKSLLVNNLLTITLTLTFAPGFCGMCNQFYSWKFVYDWALQS